MTRPESHRKQHPDKCCSDCKYAHLVAYKLDLLCFYGDNIEVMGVSEYRIGAEHVFLEGHGEVGMMDGDEYSQVWANRVVSDDDVCDFFTNFGQ